MHSNMFDPSLGPQQLTRRERERQTRRQEIIAAARTVFARKGFNDATLDDVAELAEFGKGTLYNYFESKEALFASVLQDAFDRVMKIAAEALKPGEPFEKRIETFVRGELGFLFHMPEGMYLMMRETHHLRDTGSNPMMQLLPQLLRMLGDTIAAEQRKRKVISNATPLELATILINMLFGQFSARFYGVVCQQPRQDGDGPVHSGPIDIFSRLADEELEREISSATKLIMTVYFNGISR
jgi:AcrR family transcriptional regulator